MCIGAKIPQYLDLSIIETTFLHWWYTWCSHDCVFGKTELDRLLHQRQEPSSGSSEEAHFAYFQRFKTEVFPTHITGAEKGHRREPPPRAQRPVLDVDIEVSWNSPR